MESCLLLPLLLSLVGCSIASSKAPRTAVVPGEGMDIPPCIKRGLAERPATIGLGARIPDEIPGSGTLKGLEARLGRCGLGTRIAGLGVRGGRIEGSIKPAGGNVEGGSWNGSANAGSDVGYPATGCATGLLGAGVGGIIVA